MTGSPEHANGGQRAHGGMKERKVRRFISFRVCLKGQVVGTRSDVAKCAVSVTT